jgi:dephospho-CoA kinase
MSFKLGLTGSIGMGKSTTAKILAEEGCAIWDADAAVHRLYSKGGKAVGPIQSLFSNAIVDGAVSRDQLKQIIQTDPNALKQIEAIVHPLVGEDRADFISNAQADILVFDVPLLFETGGDQNMDAVLVVSAPEEVQRQRVLARGTMTEAQFLTIKAKQMPDAEKRARADFVVITDTLDHAREQVKDILDQIRKGQAIA